jgi:uncharacterized membrane protein YkoI
MNPLIALLAACLLGLGASIAHARDLGPDEALKLRDAGTIVPLERLHAIALARHPGASVSQTELEERYGKYIYEVELRDAQGVDWDLELDAVNGQVLKDHQDS